MTSPLIYNEHTIGRAVAVGLFNHSHLVVVNNCTFPGHECDLVAVTKSLRLIEVEIKISRADFRQDRDKDKWIDFYGTWPTRTPDRADLPRKEWPRMVWKHYYAVAKPVWTDALLEYAPPRSGVFTVELGEGGYFTIDVKRRVQANNKAPTLSPNDAIDLARLGNIRMWEAYRQVQVAREGGEDSVRRAIEALDSSMVCHRKGPEWDWQRPRIKRGVVE